MAANGKWIDGIGPESRIEDAARRSLEPRLAAVARCLPPAAHLAQHDIEHVHRLRVATRRAVAALNLYGEIAAGKPARWLKKRLRRIRRAAGDARDLDVLAQRMETEHGQRIAPILIRIAKERAAVQPAIVRMAERCGKKQRFVRKTAKLLERIAADQAHDDVVQPDRFREWAADQLATVVQPFLNSMPSESADEATLHAFRIRAKAVRYTIELVAPAFGPELRDEVYPIVEELQERLGKVQDHVTARQRFQTWADDEQDDSRRQLLGELADEESRRLADEVREFHGWWTDERIEKLRRTLEHSSAAPSNTRPENETTQSDAASHSENGNASATSHPQADHQT